jgi:pyruvate dehydrogenase E2 component (dihydrolipoamide acetyltransferase)
MPIEITMPRLSDTMERGTILKWNVKEGDKVTAGDNVADIETDKATMEMSVYDDGTVAKILVDEGESVSVGTPIAVLAEDGEDVKEAAKTDGEKPKEKKATKEEPEEEREEEATDRGETEGEAREEDKPRRKREERAGHDEDEKPREKKRQQKPEPEREAAEQKEDGDRLRVSPVARRLAEEHDLDVRGIQGSGPSGRIVKRDVLQAVEAGQETKAAVAPAARRKDEDRPSKLPAVRVERAHALAFAEAEPLRDRIIQLSNMRQTIARRLVESKQTIPHYQVTYTFDMDALIELRSTLNAQLEKQGVKLSLNDFIVRACALAMHRHHEFNASWDKDSIRVHGEVNVGVAISLPAERGGGLVVATIRNADLKGLRIISAETRRLAERARSRGLSIEEMGDSTFTVSNLGMFGVQHFTAIINPPNSAILAVGAALQKPVVRDGQLTVGHEMSATLSCDHRVIDGAMAAEYLQTLRHLLENPATLLV